MAKFPLPRRKPAPAPQTIVRLPDSPSDAYFTARTVQQQAIVAAARSLEAAKAKDASGWAPTADDGNVWRHYALVPAASSAARLVSNALSRGDLVLIDTATGKPTTNTDARLIVDSVLGADRRPLLSQTGLLGFVAGQARVLFRTGDGGYIGRAEAYAVGAIRKDPLSSGKWRLSGGGGRPDTLIEGEVVETWEPHPLHPGLPDSPFRRNAGVLEEIIALSTDLISSTENRQHRSQTWFLPDGLDLPAGGDGDALTSEPLADVLTAPIKDHTVGAAWSPTIARGGDPDTIAGIKIVESDHAFDAQLSELRKDALRHLGLGLELSTAQATGEAVAGGHWGAYSDNAQLVSIHLIPQGNRIARDLDAALQPILARNGVAAGTVRLVFDATALRVPMDVSAVIMEAANLGGIVTADEVRTLVLGLPPLAPGQVPTGSGGVEQTRPADTVQNAPTGELPNGTRA